VFIKKYLEKFEKLEAEQAAAVATATAG